MIRGCGMRDAGGSAGRGPRRGCRQAGQHGDVAGPFARCAVLLTASRGGSCPSDEVQYCAQPGAGCKQKEEKEGRGERKETRLWGLFHQTVSFLQPDTDTLCVLSRGNKIAGSCSRRVRRDRGRSWKNWRRAILNFMTLGS